jgi:hypothetical protein
MYSIYIMTDYKEKYFKYKNKYSSIKNQLGGSDPVPAHVPAPDPAHARAPAPAPKISDVIFLPPIYDSLNIKEEMKFANTSRETRDNFHRLHNGYASKFAPDIKIIPINSICQGNDNCNLYITHSRIKDILHKNGIAIPADGVEVIPLLEPILLRTIPTANKIDGEFLVSIGVTIQNIEDWLFYDQELTKIYIPSSVTSIGFNAFSTNQLTKVTIPEGVTIIGEFAFLRNQLTEVDLPQSLITIGDGAFSNNRLTRVNIPQSITIINDFAFVRNQLRTITIPEGVTRIGTSAFSENRLTEVDLPQSLITIGISAFQNNQLTRVNIPQGVTRIGNHAFRQNKLLTVILPQSLTHIGLGTFMDNRTIKNVTIPERFVNKLTELFDQESLRNIILTVI